MSTAIAGLDGSESRLAPGTRVGGRFVVEGLLGEGGMGAVYAAQDDVIDRKVALKVLHLGSKQASARFRLEAAAASRISSRHVSAIHDYGRDDALECEYLVMELLDGAPLDAVLAERGQLPYEQAAAVGADIAEALGAAHAADVVHRDLKPGNIWLLAEGGVKVIDFGIARVVAPDQKRPGVAVTSPDVILGTPQYISPEAVEGSEVGPMADLYALGVVLFEMITGERPFVDAVPSVLCTMHLKSTPPTIAEVRSDVPVPEAYQDLVSALLEKDPNKRPQAADEVSAILRAMAKDAGSVRLVGERHSLGAKTATVVRADLAHSGSKRLPLLVGIGIALITVVLLSLVLALVSRTDTSGQSQLSATELPRPELSAPEANATVEAEVHPAPPPPSIAPSSIAPAAPSASPASVDVSVVVVPARATITLDSEPVTSPFTLPNDATEHVLEVSAPGHRPERRTLRGDRDRSLSITLRRRARRRPSLPAKLRGW